MAQGTGISVTPETLQSKYDEIFAIDEKLDAASGSESAGKRALANSIASETENSWKKVADNLVSAFEKIDDPQIRVGAFTGVLKSVQDRFKNEVDEFLAKEVANRSTDQVEISAEELSQMTDARRELVEQYRALRNILEMFGSDVSTIPEPKKRTGARGKRGPRVLTNYDFYVDGEARTASQNSLSSIANTVCKDLGWKTVDLRNFLVEQNIDLENPPAEFSVTLPEPVNKVLKGVKGEPQVDDDDDEVDPEETE